MRTKGGCSGPNIRKTNRGLMVHHSEVSAALGVGSFPQPHANTVGVGGALTLCKPLPCNCIQVPSYNLLLRDATFTSSHSKHTLAGWTALNVRIVNALIHPSSRVWVQKVVRLTVFVLKSPEMMWRKLIACVSYKDSQNKKPPWIKKRL